MENLVNNSFSLITYQVVFIVSIIVFIIALIHLIKNQLELKNFLKALLIIIFIPIIGPILYLSYSKKFIDETT